MKTPHFFCHRRNGEFGPMHSLALFVFLALPFILALFGSVMAYTAFAPIDEGNVAAAKAQIKNFDTALHVYVIGFDKLPESLDDLVNPPWGDPLLTSKSIPLDPWDNPYGYERDDSWNYVIISLGADGRPGGNGVYADIRSDELAAN